MLYINDPLLHASCALATSYTSTDTVALGVYRAHVADAGASVPFGINGVSDNKKVTRGRSPTKGRTGPVRHNAPDEFPLTDFANKIPVRVYGINVKPNDDQLSAVKTSLWRYRHDGDDDTLRDVDPYSATSPTNPTHRVFDDAARKIGLYRVRSAPLPYVGGERDDCIAPLATRYGLGYVDGISRREDLGGVIAFVPASRAGAEANYTINDVTE